MKNSLLRSRRSYSKIIGVSIIALFMLMTAISAVVLFVTPAEAGGPDSWPDCKMHYPQLPDPSGWDVYTGMAYEGGMPMLLADDFECTETGPITDLHFWGSWFDDNIPVEPVVGAPFGFYISFHADIPADESPMGYSMPGEVLWAREIIYPGFSVEEMPPSMQGWFEPPDTYVLYNHERYFQYDMFFEEPYFMQTEGTIYWVDITPIHDPGFFWGWKTSLDHFNDNAVYNIIDGPGWIELYDPTGEPLDLAFVITGDNVPPTLDDAIFTDDMYPPNWYDQGEDPDGYATMQVNWTEENPDYVEITVAGIGIFTDNSPSGGISTFNIPISGMPDGDYSITYEIKDLAGNTDTTVSGTGTDDEPLRLDSIGPDQIVEFGDPNETYHGTFEDYFVVGPNTPIRIISDDGTGVGSKELHYYVQWGDTFQNCPYVSVPQKTVYDNDITGDPYTTDIDQTPGRIVVEIYEDESCWHQIHYYCIDLLDNRQPKGSAEHWTDFIVDADAPVYQIEYEGPNFGEADGWTWIGNCTKKWINVTDIGCGDYYVSGTDKVDWYIYNVTDNTFDLWLDGVIDDWDGTGDTPEGRCVDLNPVDGEINFWINVPGDCRHYICWRVWDDLGNYDVDLEIPTPNKEKNMVDVTPPISYLGDLDPICFKDEYELCVTTDTVISIITQNVGTEPCIYPEFWTSFRIYVEDENQWYPDENGNGNYDVYGASAERFYWEGVWYYIYTGPFHFTEECSHTLEFFAKDPLCNTEEKHVYLFYVDDQAPYIDKTVGTPQYPADAEPGFADVLFIAPHTPITINAWDLGCCGVLTSVSYRISGLGYQNEWVEILGSLPYELTIGYECVHILEIVAEDCLGNKETHIEKFYVDGTPPIHSKEVGQPKCTGCGMNEGDYCITPNTPIWINATDDGLGECIVGSYHIHWEVRNMTDNEEPYMSGVSHNWDVIIYIEEDCQHIVRYWVEDNLGNSWPGQGEWHEEMFYVDDSHFEIDKQVGSPNCPNPDTGVDFCVTTGTPIKLKALHVDQCCPCPTYFEYRVWNDTGYDTGWLDVPYNLPQDNDGYYIFTFDDECFHHLDLRAYDCLGHINYHNETFYVDNQAPELVKTVGDPNCTHLDCGCIDEGDYCVTTDTEITLAYIDHGCCPSIITIEYRIWNETDGWDSWKEYLGVPITFGEECKHYLEVKVYDCLGNTAYDNETFYVDEQPPEITKTVGDPNCDHTDCSCIPDGDYCVTTDTEITITATDLGCCPCGEVTIEYKKWKVGDDIPSTWTTYISGTDVIKFDAECEHELHIRAYDCLGNTAYDNETFYVDEQPPEITKTVGDPNCDHTDCSCIPDGDYCVTTDTEITITATDLGCCPCGEVTIEYKKWKVGDDIPSTWTTYISGTDVIKFDAECEHELHIRAYDCLGNTAYDNETFYVDEQPPEITKTVGDPNCDHTDCSCIPDGDYCVTTDTEITITATDLGCCPCGEVTIEYKKWKVGDDIPSTWTTYVSGTDVIKFDAECEHELHIRAYDCLGNTAYDNETFYVDEQPPEITKTVGDPNCDHTDCSCIPDGDYCVTTDTEITITATDLGCCPCGEVTIEYKKWKVGDDIPSTWTTYVSGTDVIKFDAECEHELHIRAYDCLGNTAYDNETFYVDEQPPEITKTVGDPNCDHTDCSCIPDGDYCVTTDTEITITATDLGCCPCGEVTIEYKKWKVGDDIPSTWTTYVSGTDVIKFDAECEHELHIRAYDCLGNTAYDNETFYVDDQEPRNEVSVGIPQCPVPGSNGILYINSSTPICISAYEQGCCPCKDIKITYRVHYMDEWSEETEIDNGTCINLEDDCVHILEVNSTDCLGNKNSTTYTFYVDNTPPVSIIDYDAVAPGWEQMNEEGFGDFDNDYAWSMAVYGDYLYVGTLNTNLIGGGDGACEIWRTDGTLDEDGKYVWECVVGPGAPYAAGFADFTGGMYPVYGVRGMTVHDGLLWVGTMPAEAGVFVTDGTTWKRANLPGFGVPYTGLGSGVSDATSTRGITAYGGAIYAEAQDVTNGARVFKYTGLTDFDSITPGSWTQVNVNGFDSIDPTYNIGAGELIPFDPSTDGADIEYLYAGTWTTDAFGILEGGFDGFEIWRTSDGTTWECVVGRGEPYGYDAGFGDYDNGLVMSVEVFNGALYVGTQNFGDGAEIWRTFDGTTWECVESDGFGRLNGYIWRMIEYDGELVVGTLNPFSGCKLLKSSTGDPGTFETFALDGMDGEKNLPLLGGPVNIADQYGVRSVAVYQDSLIVGTASWGDWVDYGIINMIYGNWHPLSPYVGCEIWKISRGYMHVTKEYINCSTRIYINATDLGVDPCISDQVVIHYRVWYDDQWSEWRNGGVNENVSFTMGDFGFAQDCKHIIEYYAVDCLGNEEMHHSRTVYVDCTPPEFIIHKPVDGWYSDGESIPAVVWAEDILVNGCKSGIEEGSQGEGYLIDVFPYFKIVPLDSTNFIYDYDSHEYIGNLVIPNPSGIKDGTVLFVAGGEDNVGNGANSLITLLKGIVMDAVIPDGMDPMDWFMDEVSEYLKDRNIVFIGIDNTPPEVEIILPDDGADVGLESFDMQAIATDVLSGIGHDTEAYVTLAGVNIGSLIYNKDSGMWEGTLPIPLGIPSGLLYLNVSISDEAGNRGTDSIQVEVGKRPGPLATAVNVQPDPSIIEINGTGEMLTVTGTIQSIYPGRDVAGAEYFIQVDKPDEANYGAGISMSPDTGYTWDDVTVDVIATFDSTGMDPGIHTVWVHGVDQYGSWGTFDEEEFNLVLRTYWRPIYCEFVAPGEDDEFTVECGQRYVEVELDVHYMNPWDGEYQEMDELIGNVKVWLDSPYGAPDQYYDVEYNRYGGHHFWTDIPIYMYSDDSLLDIEAKAQDQHGNKRYDDVQINVFTTIVYDQWMEKEWNSLTLPYTSIGCNNSVEKVLASINNGNFDVVFHYDGTDWTSYVWGDPHNSLEYMFTGEEYWVHIVGEPMRFFTDTNAPTLWITDPGSEYSEKCLDDAPYHLDYEVCELETWTVMTYTQIYDQNGIYWDGDSWQGSPVWLECEYNGEDDGYTFWKYYSGGGDGIWTPGHTYNISAYAVDAAGCESEIDTHTLHIYNPSIYVEKTVEGQEELIVPIGTEFTFSIYVENDGDIEIYNVDLFDYLPYNLIYMDSATVSYNGELEVPCGYDGYGNTGTELVYIWYLDSLEPGEYLFLNFSATIDSCEIWEENIVEVFGETMCDDVYDTDDASVMGDCNCIEFIACVDGSDWVIVENGMLSIYHNDHDPIGSSDNCEDWPDYCGFISIDGVYHCIELPLEEDQYLIDGAPFLPVSIENLDAFVQLSGRGDVSWEEPCVIYIDDDSYGGGDLYTILLCGDPNDCVPSIELEKTVWREEMSWWDEYTEVEVGDTVRFNISTHIPEDGCPLYGGALEDYLPYGLDYVEGSTNMTIILGDYYQHDYGSELDPQQISDEDYMILRWGEEGGGPPGDDDGGGPMLFPGMWMYIEFEALVTDCGDYTNTANITTYYDCCNYVSDEDDAFVYGECEELIPCLEFYKEIQVPEFGDIVEQEVGEKVRFHIIVYNQGDTDFTDIVVNDNLPDGLDYDEVNGTVFSCTGLGSVAETVSPDGKTITWDLGGYVLPPGTACHIYFWVFVTAEGTQVNNANVTAYYTSFDSMYYEDDSTVIGTIVEASYTIKKYTWDWETSNDWEDTLGSARESDNYAEFKIVFNNTGDNPIVGDINITDVLPENLTWGHTWLVVYPKGLGKLELKASYYSSSTNSLYFNFTGTMQPGENITITFNASYTGGCETGYSETNVVYATTSVPDTVEVSDDVDIVYNYWR